MTASTLPLHPDDVLFFHEVKATMFRVAAAYKLPLKQVRPQAMPEEGMADCLGRCTADGRIEIVMRATVDGQWAASPRTPELVWRTAAHELAHLQHFNHGPAFWALAAELEQAVKNQQETHRERVLRKLVKMQQVRDGEAALGNAAAAEAFAAAINRMLIEHELHPSDVDYARAADDDPVIEVPVDLAQYDIERKRQRVAWQEHLARTVARAHLCTFLVLRGSNKIWFVGTRSHAVVAEYAYGTMARAAAVLCRQAYHEYGLACAKQAGRSGWMAGAPGFCEAWLSSFITRIAQRLDEARQAAVAEVAADMPGGTEVALMRLDGALTKARTYVDNKFKGKGIGALGGAWRRGNDAGAAAGRAAADSMAIGRRAVHAAARAQLTAGAK